MAIYSVLVGFPFCELTVKPKTSSRISALPLLQDTSTAVRMAFSTLAGVLPLLAAKRGIYLLRHIID